MKTRLKQSFLLTIYFGLLGAAFLSAYLVILAKTLPDPETFDARQIAESTKIYDRSGEVLLYEVFGEEKRTVIPFSDIPDFVKQATLALEDADFYNHPAINWRGIARAFLANLKRGQVVQGGSTITQQLAKNVFLSSERTLNRKFKELILAFQLEKKYSKEKILDLYLNQIPYGSNAYGIEAAAQTFFNKSAKDLTLAESAALASLPKAPSYYSPYGDKIDDLIRRKNTALEKMVVLKYITEEQKNDARKEEIKFILQAQNIKAPHFVLTVQNYLKNRYGEDYVRTAGLKVITTLNWDLQQLAERVVGEGAKRNTELYEGKNAALVAQDATTGQILALVGSKDYFDIENDGNFNVATQGLRQPGSAIKPFAYITAFKKGYTPNTIVFDLETDFDTTKEKPYVPQNFDEIFRGPINLRNALAQSINVPSVKVLYLAGVGSTLKTAQDFGITTLTERSRYGLSLALGGGEVKLIDLVGAYSVFAQDGIKHNQSLVLEVKDSKDNVLEKYEDKKIQVIDSQYTRLINDILSDQEARRPLFHGSFDLTVFPGHEVALKTGTTNDYRDAWSMGYTPSLVVGVWAGNNDNAPMQRKGGSILAAVPIWNQFMSEALKNQSLETFINPDSVLTDKPILNGQYVISNQVHDTLYYINKDNPQGPAPINPSSDSQFENWEKSVIDWAQKNSGQIQQSILTANLFNLELISPQNGAFITNPISINANIRSGADVNKIEIYFNNKLIENKTGNFGKEFNYKQQINPILETQNSFKIKIYNSDNQTQEKDILIFKNLNI